MVGNPPIRAFDGLKDVVEPLTEVGQHVIVIERHTVGGIESSC